MLSNLCRAAIASGNWYGLSDRLNRVGRLRIPDGHVGNQHFGKAENLGAR
ncbi:hypothetical protein [Leptolyngbya iicbica]|uniref:Uncharacterized protein n=1 Tax=Lyngbya confervoides BDU141951 TaxID=1574623 RepID=A0A8T6QL28_9CYAN|nr:hypothetical protein [Leptolyngbya sp. LK]